MGRPLGALLARSSLPVKDWDHIKRLTALATPPEARLPGALMWAHSVNIETTLLA